MTDIIYERIEILQYALALLLEIKSKDKTTIQRLKRKIKRLKENQINNSTMSILNIYKDKIPNDAVYIGRGRGSKWGNPFVIGKDGSREEVVEKYCVWICDNPELLNDIHELVGKDLVCFCSPKICHGNVLEIVIDWIQSSDG